MVAGSPYFATYPRGGPNAGRRCLSAPVRPILVTMPLWNGISLRVEKRVRCRRCRAVHHRLGRAGWPRRCSAHRARTPASLTRPHLCGRWPRPPAQLVWPKPRPPGLDLGILLARVLAPGPKFPAWAEFVPDEVPGPGARFLLPRLSSDVRVLASGSKGPVPGRATRQGTGTLSRGVAVAATQLVSAAPRSAPARCGRRWCAGRQPAPAC